MPDDTKQLRKRLRAEQQKVETLRSAMAMIAVWASNDDPWRQGRMEAMDDIARKSGEDMKATKEPR